MSKTDKTQPFRIKVFFYPSWVEEFHDHRNGVCELPEKATPNNIEEYDALWFYKGVWVTEYPFDRKNWKTNPRLAQSMTCYWGYSLEFWRSKMAACGCRICSKRYSYWDWGSETNRGRRHQARQYVRGGWKKEY